MSPPWEAAPGLRRAKAFLKHASQGEKQIRVSTSNTEANFSNAPKNDHVLSLCDRSRVSSLESLLLTPRRNQIDTKPTENEQKKSPGKEAKKYRLVSWQGRPQLGKGNRKCNGEGIKSEMGENSATRTFSPEVSSAEEFPSSTSSFVIYEVALRFLLGPA